MGKRSHVTSQAHEREIDRVCAMTLAGQGKPERRMDRRDQDEIFAIHCRVAEDEGHFNHRY